MYKKLFLIVGLLGFFIDAFATWSEWELDEGVLEKARKYPLMDDVPKEMITGDQSLITLGFKLKQVTITETTQSLDEKVTLDSRIEADPIPCNYGDHAYIFFTVKRSGSEELDIYGMHFLNDSMRREEEVRPDDARLARDNFEAVVKKFRNTKRERTIEANYHVEGSGWKVEQRKQIERMGGEYGRYEPLISYLVPTKNIRPWIESMRIVNEKEEDTKKKTKEDKSYGEWEWEEDTKKKEKTNKKLKKLKKLKKSAAMDNVKYRLWGNVFSGKSHNCCTFTHKILTDCGVKLPSSLKPLLRDGFWLRKQVKSHAQNYQEGEVIRIFKYYKEEEEEEGEAEEKSSSSSPMTEKKTKTSQPNGSTQGKKTSSSSSPVSTETKKESESDQREEKRQHVKELRKVFENPTTEDTTTV